jgi:hypothetical protein
MMPNSAPIQKENRRPEIAWLPTNKESANTTGASPRPIALPPERMCKRKKPKEIIPAVIRISPKETGVESVLYAKQRLERIRSVEAMFGTTVCFMSYRTINRSTASVRRKKKSSILGPK